MCPLRVSKERLTVAPDAMGMVEAAPCRGGACREPPECLFGVAFLRPISGERGRLREMSGSAGRGSTARRPATTPDHQTPDSSGSASVVRPASRRKGDLPADGLVGDGGGFQAFEDMSPRRVAGGRSPAGVAAGCDRGREVIGSGRTPDRGVRRDPRTQPAFTFLVPRRAASWTRCARWSPELRWSPEP